MVTNISSDTGPNMPIFDDKVDGNGDNTSAQPNSSDTEDNANKTSEKQELWDWETDPHNPYNWSSGKKAVQIGAIASIAFLA